MLRVRIYGVSPIGDYVDKSYSFDDISDAPDDVRVDMQLLDAAANENGYASLVGVGMRYPLANGDDIMYTF